MSTDKQKKSGFHALHGSAKGSGSAVPQPEVKQFKNAGYSWTFIILSLSVVGAAIYFSSSTFEHEFHLFTHKTEQGEAPGLLTMMMNSFKRDESQFVRYDKTINKVGGHNEVAADQTQQQSSVSDMVDAFYNIVTDFYEYGWGQSFHFAHTRNNETHEGSILRHEWRIADAVGLKQGMKALDAGCGVGGPARGIARHTQANIVGITINEYQVKRAREYNKQMKLDHLIEIVQGDYTKLPMSENFFDASYSIEATCHAKDLRLIYGEAFRTLKPGGLFASYEWLTTKLYDPNNAEHVRIIKEIEYGNALPPIRSLQDALDAAKEVGFEFVHEEDLAADKVDTRPWYHRLEINHYGRMLTHYFTMFMEAVRLAPEGSVNIHTVLLRAADGLVDGGKTGTFTPMHLVVFRKPMKA